MILPYLTFKIIIIIIIMDDDDDDDDDDHPLLFLLLFNRRSFFGWEKEKRNKGPEDDLRATPLPTRRLTNENKMLLAVL